MGCIIYVTSFHFCFVYFLSISQPFFIALFSTLVVVYSYLVFAFKGKTFDYLPWHLSFIFALHLTTQPQLLAQLLPAVAVAVAFSFLFYALSIFIYANKFCLRVGCADCGSASDAVALLSHKDVVTTFAIVVAVDVVGELQESTCCLATQDTQVLRETWFK